MKYFLITQRSDESLKITRVVQGFVPTKWGVVIPSENVPTEQEAAAAIASKLADKAAEATASAARVSLYENLGDNGRTAAQHLSDLRQVARQLMRLHWRADGSPR